MLRRLPALLLTLPLLAHAGIVDDTARDAGRGFAEGVSEGTTKSIERIARDQERRNKEAAAESRHRQRLANLSGCATNAKKTTCKCFDKQGNIDTILNDEQCLEVVRRGIGAVSDF